MVPRPGGLPPGLEKPCLEGDAMPSERIKKKGGTLVRAPFFYMDSVRPVNV